MRLGVPKETDGGETRAALVPAVVKKLVASGVEVVVESGLGVLAGASDGAYEGAGARVVSSPDEPSIEVWGSDVVVTVRPPIPRQVDAMRPGGLVAGLLAPLRNGALVRRLASRGVSSIALELVPRISRAQAMDALSSQANLAGYKAVTLAAERCPKVFPMMITAAGTLAPAKVVVLGVGVAGLQAIATAKRLGAVVEANDIRAATKEQVRSLGARFIELPNIRQDDAATGGYARELTEEQKREQQALVARHVAQADVVIATAAVFGKAPPVLIPAEVVDRMQPGSVIVDLAADIDAGRGNCELTRPGETYVTAHGVTIMGPVNAAALAPVHASQAYANNLHALLKEIIHRPEGGAPALKLDLSDEVLKSAVVTHRGEIVNELVKQVVGGGGA